MKGRAREIQKEKLRDVELLLDENSGAISRSRYYRARVLRQLLRERRMREDAKPSD